MLRLLALFVLVRIALAAPPADEVRVVITGDGRADRKGVRPSDRDGVNVAMLSELVTATMREGAHAFAFTGDLVLGDKDEAVLAQQFRTWMASVKPLLDKGIRVLPVRGNHDTGKRDNGLAARTRLYREIVAMPCAIPDNGPEGEKLLTYSLRIRNTLLVGLDQYAGEKVAVNVTWFEDQLSRSDAEHVIPFAHEMAFTAGRHEDHMGGERGDVAARDRFWKSLVKHKVAWFFAGHDHLYDRMTVAPKEGGNAVTQVVAGTAGAPFYEAREHFRGDDVWTARHEAGKTQACGYVLVTISGGAATMAYKSRTEAGEYVEVDRWAYSR